jgi:predicted alpha/beta-hydrolase family hydrolase
MTEQYVDTPVGRARLDWFPARGTHRATVLLGHGTATGVEATDLQALARALPDAGTAVVLMTQPYRIEHDRRVSDEQSLDAAWAAVWPQVSGSAPLVVSGGRSAGSQVACRTAAALGPDAVLILAYPLRGPGSPRELLSVGKRALIVQGGADQFGRPGEFPALPPTMQLIEIPSANHMLASTTDHNPAATLAMVTSAAIDWIDRLQESTPTRT